jgi:uncharacterized membrane protein YhiD involved in acid resistance
MKINNESEDKLWSGLAIGISVFLVLILGSLPGSGQYFGAFLVWIAVMFVWAILSRWVFKVNRRLSCLEEIRDLATENNKQNFVKIQQNDVIENLLRDIKDKL